jgi:hypothetical protein
VPEGFITSTSSRKSALINLIWKSLAKPDDFMDSELILRINNKLRRYPSPMTTGEGGWKPNEGVYPINKKEGR